MPLAKVVRVNQHIIYGIWDITEEIEDLLEDDAFQNQEAVDVSTLHPKKQLEYATSRILIAKLCGEIGYSFSGIIKDEFGKPNLKGCNFHLSISHSYPYAVAIINQRESTGIDIEYPTNKLTRISSKFLNESELRYEEDLGDLCKVWCVKETLYKIYGRRKVDYRKHLHVDLGVAHDRCIGRFSNEHFDREYEIRIEEYEGFIYCYNV
ncbi:MAG: 4'-phosphopantetheinyl transferase superfamily protein [Cyclobacteriaceae bacterium]